MNQESVPTLPKGSQNKNLSEEQDAVVPLQDVKAALQVANAKQEIYSASTLAYLVRKYTVLGVLAISILGSGCAPIGPTADRKAHSLPTEIDFPYCDIVDNGETEVMVCKKTLEEGAK